MRQSLLVATAILVIFIVSVGANVVNVNAGRSHPLQTVGPGYCVPNQVSVQEMCPDKKTWKRGLVCINGQLVPQTQDCPGETETETQTAQCNAGDPPRDVTNCKHAPDHWETRKECVNGAWKEITNPSPCPICVGVGTIRVENGKEVKLPCPNDPESWSWAIVCNGVDWEEEYRPCKGSECKPEGNLNCLSKCYADAFFTTKICKTGFKCTNGHWEDYQAPEGDCKECFIATATFGSELSPEVQLLRNFRDRDVLQTYAGGEGMKVFNLIYYSFSPQVAQTISANGNVRTVMRYLLYPLIGILWVSQQIYSALAFSPEGAIVVAGAFTGTMIGLLYMLPFYGVSLVVSRAFRRRLAFKHVSLSLVLLATASTLIVVSEVTRFGLLMQLSTSLLALTAAALPGITFSAWALNRHR